MRLQKDEIIITPWLYVVVRKILSRKLGHFTGGALLSTKTIQMGAFKAWFAANKSPGSVCERKSNEGDYGWLDHNPTFHFDCQTAEDNCFGQYHLSNPKPGHTTGGSGRGGARRGGGAGPGRVGPVRAGRRQNSSPRGQPSLVPSKASKTNVVNVSPEARTSEILCKPMEEHSDRLTSGLSAGRRPLFVPGC